MELGEGAKGDKIRVFVADSSRIHTQLLSDALRKDADLVVVHRDSAKKDLVAEIVAGRIDVLVVSIHLDEEPLRGLAILRELRSLSPRFRAAVLLDSPKRDLILEAFRAGARGIFSRHDSVEMLGKCIRSLHDGQIWANSEQMALAVEALSSDQGFRTKDVSSMNLLTKREAEVVECLAEGLTNREIAERLKLSQHTVKNYLFRVFEKLGVSSRVELLFMTLSRESDGRNILTDLLGGAKRDEKTFALCRRAAEEGSLAAQLALAQMYFADQSDPENLTQAYTWYLIAAEQLNRTKGKTSRTLRPEQRIQAEQQAAEWLRTTQPISPAIQKTPSNARVAGASLA